MNYEIIFTQLPVAELMAQFRQVIKEEINQMQEFKLAEKLMTPKQTAEFLHVSLVTIWQWEKQGRITKHTLGGRTYFKYSEIMAEIETLKKHGRNKGKKYIV